MRTQEEIIIKIQELKDKTFDILSKAYETKSPFKTIGLKNIKIAIEALEYSAGLRENLTTLCKLIEGKNE